MQKKGEQLWYEERQRLAVIDFKDGIQFPRVNDFLVGKELQEDSKRCQGEKWIGLVVCQNWIFGLNCGLGVDIQMSLSKVIQLVGPLLLEEGDSTLHLRNKVYTMLE